MTPSPSAAPQPSQTPRSATSFPKPCISRHIFKPLPPPSQHGRQTSSPSLMRPLTNCSDLYSLQKFDRQTTLRFAAESLWQRQLSSSLERAELCCHAGEFDRRTRVCNQRLVHRLPCALDRPLTLVENEINSAGNRFARRWVGSIRRAAGVRRTAAHWGRSSSARVGWSAGCAPKAAPLLLRRHAQLRRSDATTETTVESCGSVECGGCGASRFCVVSSAHGGAWRRRRWPGRHLAPIHSFVISTHPIVALVGRRPPAMVKLLRTVRRAEARRAAAAVAAAVAGAVGGCVTPAAIATPGAMPAAVVAVPSIAATARCSPVIIAGCRAPAFMAIAALSVIRIGRPLPVRARIATRGRPAIPLPTSPVGLPPAVLHGFALGNTTSLKIKIKAKTNNIKAQA